MDRSIRTHARAFMVQQPSFALHATAVSGQAPIRTDDAVTRHHDGNGIGPIRETNRAARFWAAQVGGELAIACLLYTSRCV